MCAKNCSRGSSPPADAPRPTQRPTFWCSSRATLVPTSAHDLRSIINPVVPRRQVAAADTAILPLLSSSARTTTPTAGEPEASLRAVGHPPGTRVAPSETSQSAKRANASSRVLLPGGRVLPFGSFGPAPAPSPPKPNPGWGPSGTARRCPTRFIPAGCVAPRLQTLSLHPGRALPAGRLDHRNMIALMTGGPSRSPIRPISNAPPTCSRRIGQTGTVPCARDSKFRATTRLLSIESSHDARMLQPPGTFGRT